ncbi:hypothetical protein [Eikenella halliae]|uniref:hypothetical protein n=1 Tax=Eikenella halliae TaxID=1795832 RepID=UPI0028D05BE4|nr:hypothetical protein [Eikenella halliae]
MERTELSKESQVSAKPDFQVAFTQGQPERHPALSHYCSAPPTHPLLESTASTTLPAPKAT